MVSAGRSTRARDAQVAVAFRGEPGIADAARAAAALSAVARAGRAPPCGPGIRTLGVTMTGEGRPDR